MYPPAAGFAAAGLEKGDRVAIWAPNRLDWIVGCVGAQAAGCIVVPLNTRLKGGEAAFILNRMQGQGRSQEVVTVTNYAATPGMEARLTMPNTEVQIGRVTRVEFGLTEGFMVLGSRGLTDTPDTAYIFGDPGITYDDVPAGMTYNTFDWSLI